MNAEEHDVPEVIQVATLSIAAVANNDAVYVEDVPEK
jgi:hypothetical protein